MPKKNLLAFILLTLAVFTWSGNFIFGRYLHADFPAFGISLWRWGIALAILIAVNIRHLFSFLKTVKANFYKLFLLSLFSVVLCSSFQYVGLQYTTATDAGIVLATMPIFITLCAEVILKEKTEIKQRIGIALAFMGTLLLITEGKLERIIHLSFNYGDLILIMTSFMWGVYSSLLKKYKLPLTSWQLVQATSLIGFILINIILIGQGKEHVSNTFAHLNTMSVIAFLYMGVCASLIGLWCWNRGVEILGPIDAGIFIYLMPIFSGVLGALFLNEHIHSYHLIGALIISGGVYLTLKSKIDRA